MITFIVSLLTFISALTVFAVGFANLRFMCHGRALLPNSLLQALYLLNLERNRVPYCVFLCLLQLGACFVRAYGAFNSSNHFILSLDILFFFSTLLLILFHALKITEIPSAR